MKSAYEFIVNSRGLSTSPLSAEEWRQIWKLKIQHRLKLLLWKEVAGALPVKGLLGRWNRNLQEDSWICRLCREHEESATHLFLE